jgi:predicted solute-binding protein
MAQFRVGCVPYVNARPLVSAFDQPNEFVEVVYDVPSKLPALLDTGEVDAILVSSIELLRRADLRPAAEVGIMSYGPVQSVRLLSKVPLTEIKSLALDQSSMTSNILAQVILAEQGVFPTTETLSPDAPNMLAHHDACVIIGDRGYEANGAGLVDLDLGHAWTEMTGLPFVWALWLSKKNGGFEHGELWQILYLAYKASGFSSIHSLLDREIRKDIRSIEKPSWKEKQTLWAEEEKGRREHVVRSTLSRCSWSEEQIESYLTNGVRYQANKSTSGLKKFRELIEKYDLCPLAEIDRNYSDLKREIFDLIPS